VLVEEVLIKILVNCFFYFTSVL